MAGDRWRRWSLVATLAIAELKKGKEGEEGMSGFPLTIARSSLLTSDFFKRLLGPWLLLAPTIILSDPS